MDKLPDHYMATIYGVEQMLPLYVDEVIVD